MDTQVKQIQDFQVLDHGIDHVQYFQGCGVFYTDYTYVCTGCGNNCKEAISDALDQVAELGYDSEDLESRIKKQFNITEFATKPNTDKYHEENEDSEMYYYLSIRFK